MPADAGIKFGSYVLLRRIARGGMAEVFLAQQRGLEGFDRRVAVKRILPHLVDSPDFVKMFLGEAKLAAQLAHPNIVHIYEFGKVDHDYFIAMEFVDGVHAGQIWKQGESAEKLSPTLVARIGADAAAALHHAHELRGSTGKPVGLVHRDVSPANIMISYDGVVKLCDFGIAKAAAVTDQLTNPGQVKGKYAYMSPEQTIAQPLDGRSDVFSLAIVLWELLTGKYVVPRGDAVAAMRMIRDGKIEPIAVVAPATPPPLAKAIAWALEPRREQRATAAELAQALEAFIKSSPELATPMQLGAWVRQRFVREQTGQHTAMPPIPGHGTQVASPGTVVAPGTAASQSLGAVTPQPPDDLIGASRLAHLAAEVHDTSDLDETIDTLKVKPFRGRVIAPDALTPRPVAAKRGFAPASGATTLDKPLTPDTIIEAASRINAASRAAAEEPTLFAGREPAVPADAETSDARETIELDGARVVPMSSGPAIVPTAYVTPVSGPRERLSAPPQHGITTDPVQRPRALGLLTPWRMMIRRPGVDHRRQRRVRIAVAIAGLFALALASFLIALAASGSHKQAAAPIDAGVAEIVAPPPPAADAAAIAADAPRAVVVPADAMPEAYLEVSTIPDGGKLKVGDQVRTAPAQIIVAAGTLEVTAELAGFQPESRTVTIEPGEHQKIEVTFTRKLVGGRPIVVVGRLSVRTTPYSEVYENGRKLGETPFADRELPAGTHTLVFKHPAHPTVTKKITITAGKPTKLNFALP